MILTVTLNPLLERRFEYPKIVQGTVNRNPSKESLNAGGKGINVSRQLNSLNLDNIALTFSGGASGRTFKKITIDENIKTAFVQTEAETRSGIVAVDTSENIITTYIGHDVFISDAEADEFLTRLEKMMANCEVLVLSGSSPCKATDDIFPAAIKLANDLDKISILDTYGRHLGACIDSGPTVLHNNIDELNNFHPLPDEKSIFSFLDELYNKGIKQSFITAGSTETFASAFDFHYKISNPSITEKDPTGSGDAFVAGLVYGWHNNLTFEESAILATCLGASNASVYPVCSVKREEADKLKSSVKVIPVGKKMKILDVTPD